jgi:molecular chaperone IbpA
MTQRSGIVTVTGGFRELGRSTPVSCAGNRILPPERRFSLADQIKVTGASLENGLLYIDVVREVPKAAKSSPPRY